MAKHDRPVGHAQGTCGTNIFEVAGAQKFSSHNAHQSGPSKERHQPDQKPEVHRHDRRHNDDNVERGGRAPDLHETLENQIDPAAKIPLQSPCRNPDDRGQNRHDQREQNREAEAIDHTRQHVACGVICAQPVGAVGGGWCRAANVVHCIIAERHNRPHDPADGYLFAIDGPVCRVLNIAVRVVETVDQTARDNEALNFNITVDRLGPEVATKGRFWIKAAKRRVVAVLIFDQNRLIVGDDLGAKRQPEKDGKHPQRPNRPAVGLEVTQATLVHGGKPSHTQVSRLSKSMRGSIQTYIKSDNSPTTKPISVNTNSVPKITG